MEFLLCCCVLAVSTLCRAEAVGKRPYEMDWAGRIEDDQAPLVDFEQLDGWRVEGRDVEARFERSREQQIWGRYVGKLTYRATGGRPTIRVLPPGTVRIGTAFDTVTCWVYGNNWAYAQDPGTPQIQISALFAVEGGAVVNVPLTRVRWREWFLCHRRLTPEQIRQVAGGAAFAGFEITNCTNRKDRVVFVDNFAVFAEQFPALTFQPRPRRGIDMFPGQGVGTNSGPGRLPFPTRPATILPDNLAAESRAQVLLDGDAGARLVYSGTDGTLTYRYAPTTGTLSDIEARWEGLSDWFRPCAGGGVRLAGGGNPAMVPEQVELLAFEPTADGVVSRWRMAAGVAEATVTLTLRLWGKTLVVDVAAPGGRVSELHYGRAVGLAAPRLVTLPYYTYGQAVRPAVVVSGTPAAPLFLAGHTDWTLSNASAPWAENGVTADGVAYNGGVRYIPRTDGRRNDCFERLFLSVSPRFEETLPNIPNPVSPWKHVTGTRVWRAHGASSRRGDKAFWRRCHRFGMTMVAVTDHETGWRDGGESFTFRTRTAPGKGGDQGQFDYARVMQDELGFVYGPYNNYTDFAPVNEFWDVDLVNRRPDRQLQTAWARCYAPKPARAVEYCAKLAPIIEQKFRFSTAYCDVHTAVTPWARTDFDHRVPGAATFAATFYSYGEIMLLQKKAWDGPVYSEGNNHWLYCGLTDGNYAQDQRARLPDNPWLVDFDLRKMHHLCCNFGMGNTGMFYGKKTSLGETREQVDASIDRFLAATVAFGHTGFLVFERGYHNALRSYYLLQQLHSRYALSAPASIRYVAADGRLLTSTEAVATGAHERSQIVTRYDDGTVTVVNGSRDSRLVTTAHGRRVDLPPNAYVGWTEDGSIDVFSGERAGHRADCAVTPEYIYVDGRGRFARFGKAASSGIGICRMLPGSRYEVIPYQGSECGFAVAAVRAHALSEDRKMLGPAELRRARGLTYVMPVEGSFSYILEGGAPEPGVSLRCDRTTVVPGETVVVHGMKVHTVTTPADLPSGARWWRKIEGAWIDFTTSDLAEPELSVNGNLLQVALSSMLPAKAEIVVSLAGMSQTVELEPGQSGMVAFDLGEPQVESADVLKIVLQAGALRQEMEAAIATLKGYVPIAELPARWSGGMQLRGEAAQSGFGQTRAYVYAVQVVSGGLGKAGLKMHPPWVGGVGAVFALYDPIRLPAGPAAAFRAVVGKGDGSDLGDGILYKVAVVGEDGRETVVAEETVTEHEWVPIEADLGPWRGRTVRLKLIADVGVADDSSGDWACWGDMRVESREALLSRRFGKNAALYRTEPGPLAADALTLAALRGAKQGWLHYDGIGLTGTGGAYESYAVLNGVEIGAMAPAQGREAAGVWSDTVAVPLTPQAIARLNYRNSFEVSNPGSDCFKLRRFWLELDLADGRKCSSRISTCVVSQPPTWRYAEGVGTPQGKNVTVDIWFPRE